MVKKTISMILAIILIIGIIPYNKVEATTNSNVDVQTGTTVGGRLTVKDRPKVIKTTPNQGERYLDPGRLYRKFSNPAEEGYYIKVVFENIGNTLGLMNNPLAGITVVGEDGNNIVDTTKTPRYEKNNPRSEFTLYIPLKDKPGDGQVYTVFIPENNVVEYTDVAIEADKGNRSYRFTFNTNYLPKADRLYEGSVPEHYDWNYPIVIDGSMFNRNIRVSFKDMRGRFYDAGDVIVRGDSILYIYLPKRYSLPIGLYDIVISNGRNYDTEMVYGVLSVVGQGDYIPNEEYRIKDENKIGVVKEIIKTSKDIIGLETKQSYLEINLDELMGSEVWVRSLKYPTNRNESLSELMLKSKWANTTIRNLRLQNDPSEKHIEFRVGRVEPSMADIIKKRLVGNNIKSNFIEVSGANFGFSGLYIEIPYFESDGSSLRMLRYDEATRTFEDVPSTIDLVDGKLKGTSNKPGIFVIVE